MKSNLRLSYNAPVTLTFAFLCALILLLDQFALDHNLIPAIFTVPGNRNATVSFNWQSGLDYIRLFTHIFGHSDWNHLLGNFAWILLLGPLMEERYGSVMILVMSLVTTFVTGIINVCFIPSSLLGASGIAFMLVILASISRITKNEIPLSFILILAVFIGRELLSPSSSNISTMAHIAGGLCGSLFGFMTVPKEQKIQIRKASPAKKTAKPRTEENDEESPRLKKTTSALNKDSSDKDDDATVIGTLKW